MHLTICYNQATKRVAFVEAPEEFIQVLLELGTCNLDALSALLEPAAGLQAATDSKRIGISASTPLAKLTSGLGGPRDVPVPMSQSKWMEHLLSAINPGPSLKQLLLSVVRPGEDCLPSVCNPVYPKISRTFRECRKSFFEKGGLFHSPFTFEPGNRCVYCPPGACFPRDVNFLPAYEGQEDLDPAQHVYACGAGCDIFSNNPDYYCPQCTGLKLTKKVHEADQWRPGRASRGLPTQTPKTTSRKTSEVVPVVKRTKDEKLCLLTDELEPLNPHSVVGVMQIMRTSGVLFSAEETSAVSVKLGCKEVLALARLARSHGQKQVLSTVFAAVLVTADAQNL